MLDKDSASDALPDLGKQKDVFNSNIVVRACKTLLDFSISYALKKQTIDEGYYESIFRKRRFFSLFCHVEYIVQIKDKVWVRGFLLKLSNECPSVILGNVRHVILIGKKYALPIIETAALNDNISLLPIGHGT